MVWIGKKMAVYKSLTMENDEEEGGQNTEDTRNLQKDGRILEEGEPKKSGNATRTR
jgi:hypothetical protein